MPQVVTGPDGNTITFPDGTNDAVVNQVMAQAYPDQAKATPGGTQPGGAQPGTPDPQSQPASQPAAPAARPDFVTSLFHGADQAFDNASTFLENTPPGQWIEHAGTAMGLPSDDETAAQHAAYFAQQEQQGKGSNDLAGNVAGNLMFTAPALAATGIKGPIASGAVSGALGTNDPHDALGTGIDAVSGGVLGKLGGMAINGVGNAINPLVRPFVQKMVDSGVQLTPGSILGGAGKMIENGLKYVPGVGEMIGGAQDRMLTGFNNAAYNEALGYVGGKLPDGITGHEAAAYTQKTISQAYERLLPSMKVMGDNQFRTDMSDLANMVKQGGLPADKVEQFARLMQGVGGRFSRAGGMTGRTMQDVDSLLGQEYSDYRGSSNPDDQKMARAILQAQSNLRDLVYRSNPQAATQLAATRQAFKTFVPAETAAGSGSTDELGRFQPGQLKGAIAQNDSAVRNRTTAQGKAPLEDIANAGIGTMGRTVRSVGSLNPLIRGGTGAAALAAHAINPATIATTAAITAPYTETGGKITQSLLTGRQGPGWKAAGDAVRRLSGTAGAVAGASAPKRQKAVPYDDGGGVTIESVTPATPAQLRRAR